MMTQEYMYIWYRIINNTIHAALNFECFIKKYFILFSVLFGVVFLAYVF